MIKKVAFLACLALIFALAPSATGSAVTAKETKIRAVGSAVNDFASKQALSAGDSARSARARRSPWVNPCPRGRTCTFAQGDRFKSLARTCNTSRVVIVKRRHSVDPWSWDSPWTYRSTKRSATGHLKTDLFYKNSFRSLELAKVCIYNKLYLRYAARKFVHKNLYVNYNCSTPNCNLLYKVTKPRARNDWFGNNCAMVSSDPYKVDCSIYSKGY